MKRNAANIIFIVIVILLMTALIAFYLYDVICVKTPFTKNLFRTIAILFVLLGTLVRLINGKGRKSLDFYEKAYADELGFAFKSKPLMRKKLLCAARLYDESNYRKALKYLFELLREAEFDRDSLPTLLFIALCYTDAGVSSEALKVYHEYLKIDPNDARIHSNIGHLYAKEGDYESALKHYNRSIEIKPENYYAYVNRANYYFRKREYDPAISDAKQALEYKNNGVEAASLLAIIYSLLKDDENKKHYYHIAITSGKSPKDLNDAIEYFLNEENIPSEEA